MIKLKSEVNKAQIMRELKAEAKDMYNAAYEGDYAIERFLLGAERLFKKLRIGAVMRSVNGTQELYCGNCDKDTRQKVDESGHERDSSHDRFECTECGFVKYGLTGEWGHPA